MGSGALLKRAAVFLDRDGVLNRAVIRAGKPYPPTSWAELEILPGVCVALDALKQAGYWLIVVTNQPDVARGSLSRAQVVDMNRRLQTQLELDRVMTCFHDDSDQCACRKPRPGLLLEAACSLNIDLSASFMVGDRWRDIVAGQQAGCKTFFIDYGYAEPQPVSYDYKAGSLLEAACLILNRSLVVAQHPAA